MKNIFFYQELLGKKKLISFLAVLFLFLPLIGKAITREDLEKKAAEVKTNNPEISVDYTKLKESIIATLDRNIAKVNSAIAKIESSSMDSANKKLVINSLVKVKSDLEAYKQKVNEADSMEELKALNQEIINYLKANKDVIKQQVSQSIMYLGKQVFIKADEILKQAEQALAVLKIQCKGKTGSETLITQLEGQIKTLGNYLDTLEQALASKNSAQVKSIAKEIMVLTQTMIITWGSLQGLCGV